MDPIQKHEKKLSRHLGPDTDEIDLAQLAGVLVRYRLTIAIVFLVGFLGALTFAQLATPIYRSDVLLQVEDSGSRLGVLADLQLAAGIESDTKSDVEIIRSRAVLAPVVDKLRLTVEARPDYVPVLGAYIARQYSGVGGEQPSVGVGSYAGGRERIRITRLTVPSRYLDQELTLIATENGGYVIQNELGETLVKGAVGTETAMGGISVLVEELVARQGIQFVVTVIHRNHAIDELRERLEVNLRGGRGIKKGNIIELGFEHEDPGRAAAILNAISQEYVHYSIKRNTEEAEKTLTFIEKQLKDLSKDASFNNELYLMLVAKAQELRVLKAGIIGKVHIVDSALTPIKPSKPKKAVIVGLGGLLGLMAGVLLAFMRQAMDRSVHFPEEIEAKIDSTVYSIIPHSRLEKKNSRILRLGRDGKAVSRPLLCKSDVGDIALEGFRYLRTSLQYDLARRGQGATLMIAGPTPDVGKTFISANLAHMMAQTGKRVLLIDTDLRKGVIHEYFGLKKESGLSEYLSEEVGEEEIRKVSGTENLDIVTAGKTVTDSSALLDGERLQNLFDKLRVTYDILIVDTPPILAVADGIIVSRACNALLVVARSGRTTLSDITACQRRLDQAEIESDGIILNDVKLARAGYGYPYGGYGYMPEYLHASPRKRIFSIKKREAEK